MEKETLDKHIRIIEEHLVDEGNIVTCKWLCRKISVHINTAKQILHTYATEYTAKYPEKLSCTYWISGITLNGDRIVTVANEDSINSIRKDLVNVTSEHVYSVQKGTNLPDLQSLYIPDRFTEASAICPIICKEAVLRPVTEAPLKKSPAKPTVQNVAAAKAKPIFKEAESKPKETKVEPVKQEPVKRTIPKKASTISSMFSAQNSKPKVTAKPLPKKEVVVEEETKDRSPDRKIPESPKATSNKAANKSKKRNKQKKGSDEVGEKKRKRIQVFSDSEDSDNDAARERSPSPEPEAQPEPELKMLVDSDGEENSAQTNNESQKGKRKKRKMVDKLVMNDDGYMETKKEMVLMTDSEDEAPTPAPAKPVQQPVAQPAAPAQNKKSPGAAKAASPVKKGRGKAAPSDGRKQASLLSFFKKN